jgi:integrase/recombinase XerD
MKRPKGKQMSSGTDPDGIEWFRYPFVAAHDLAKAWLTTETLLGLAPNTLDAYARGLDDFLGFCQRVGIEPVTATRGDLARYVGDLRGRPRPHTHQRAPDLAPLIGLSNATLQQRLTAVRLFFDFLIEEGQRTDHPVGRGRYTPGKAFGAGHERALVPRFQTLPWIPSDEQWRAFLEVVKQAPLRTRCMAALAYDAGLRREELCSLQSTDLDPAHRMVRVQAEVAKGSRERVVPYSATTGELLRAYLAHRRTIAKSRGPIFLSESPRNFAQPITLWTWSKVVRQLALQADLPRFSTHTFRHLCLTDLARSGWEIHQIAQFAGHRNPQTTAQ